MKNKIFGVIALLLVTVMALSSCTVLNGIKDFINGIGEVVNPPVELTDAPLAGDMLIDFEEGANPDVLFESDGWTNGDVFNVVWKKHNVFYGDGIMRLGITEESAKAWLGDGEVEFNYTAGEARTQNYYHYGDYEVRMKPSANPGTASTFFTCTGPYDTKFVLDENGDYLLDDNGQRVTVENPHDEIDIEFLGDDTTHVQFNFFVNGVGGNEYMYDLGFDASEDFHNYGFRWEPDSITWFVDGEPVYKVTTDTTVKTGSNLKIVEKLPSTPGRMLTNYWCGTERAWGWMGVYQGTTKDQGTEYKWMKTSAKGAPLNPEEAPAEDETTELDWADIAPIAPTFPTAEKYIVETDGNKAHVTYTDVGGSEYKPIEMDITEVAEGKNYVYLKVTNNGTDMVQVRVNVIDQALVDAGAQNMATNVSATMNGTSVNTDLVWGGSFFEIEGGATAELIVKFSGEVEKLQLMIDSSRNDQELRSGNITVEDIKFAAIGEEKPVDPPVSGGEDNTDPQPWDGKLSYKTANTYVITPMGQPTESVNVTYSDIKDNSYWNVNAWIKDAAHGKTNVSLKIKNNGTETVYITVKIEAAGAVALMEGKMEIPAGEEHSFSQSFSGTAEMLYFFIDSGWSTETKAHSGNVTISGVSFGGETTPPAGDDPVTPPAGDDPATPPAGDEDTDDHSELTFVTGSYTIDPNNAATDTLNVSYTDIEGGTYQNICSKVESFANNFGKFTVTIKNNGEATVRVRIDLKGTKTVGNTDICNTEIIGGEWTDLEWGGSFVNVAAGEEVTVTVCYKTNHGEGKDFGSVIELLIYFDTSTYQDTNKYSGNLTLSNFSFSN